MLHNQAIGPTAMNAQLPITLQPSLATAGVSTGFPGSGGANTPPPQTGGYGHPLSVPVGGKSIAGMSAMLPPPPGTEPASKRRRKDNGQGELSADEGTGTNDEVGASTGRVDGEDGGGDVGGDGGGAGAAEDTSGLGEEELERMRRRKRKEEKAKRKEHKETKQQREDRLREKSKKRAREARSGSSSDGTRKKGTEMTKQEQLEWSRIQSRDHSRRSRQRRKQLEENLKDEIKQLQSFRTLVEDSSHLISICSPDMYVERIPNPNRNKI